MCFYLNPLDLPQFSFVWRIVQPLIVGQCDKREWLQVDSGLVKESETVWVSASKGEKERGGGNGRCCISQAEPGRSCRTSSALSWGVYCSSGFFIFSPSLRPHSSPLTQRTQWRRKKRRENRGVRRERERQVDYPFLEEPRAEEWEGQ